MAAPPSSHGSNDLQHLHSSYAFSVDVWPIAVQCFLQDNPGFKKYGIPSLPPPPKYSNPLKMFCYLITFQAISNSVCEKIWDRFVRAVNKRMFDNGIYDSDVWRPEILHSFAFDELYGKEGVGLSKRKITAIHNIATYIQEHPSIFAAGMDSQHIIKDISKSVKGVGPFVVQHFLKENGRMDITTHDDLVFRRGVQKLFRLEKTPTVSRSKKLIKWSRFQTIGSSYCFHIAHLPVAI